MSADHINWAARERKGQPSALRRSSGLQAFTLLELLLVVTIIGFLASVALPHMAGFGKSNSMISGTRQLLDDVALARQKALSTRSTVYMVFLPQDYWNNCPYNENQFKKLKDAGGAVFMQATNLLSGQLTSYALYSPRSVGDQPGNAHPRYLSAWKTLPRGVFIPPEKFNGPKNIANNYVVGFDYTNSVTFPNIANGVSFYLPYIAFNSRGEISSEVATSADSVIIPLTRGSAMLMPDWTVSVQETPKDNYLNDFNLVVIDKVTGRAKLLRQEIQ